MTIDPQRHAVTPDRPELAKQLELFGPILSVYAEAGGQVSNERLYEALARRQGEDVAAWGARQPIGAARALHSPAKRRARWLQQSLRQLGLLERTGLGTWKLTPQATKELTPAEPRVVLLGFSTDLGLALWGSGRDVFAAVNEPIHLVLTSPPYPLAQPRRYGNPAEAQYVDWLCEMLEPVVKHLVPGGSIALNVSNDVFIPGLPARSLYRERLVIALHERLGLYRMDELIWHNSSKPPGPIAWASKERFQLNTAWEPILWMTNDPRRVRADNRRVLEPHSDRQKRLIAAGGERRHVDHSDGAYRIRHGSYGRPTEGRIPRNVLAYGHQCPDLQRCRDAARAAGQAIHGAPMPLRLARFLVEWLSEPGDLVVDNFAGWFTTAKAAQETGRRWLAAELMAEYVIGSASRVKDAEGFQPGPLLTHSGSFP